MESFEERYVRGHEQRYTQLLCAEDYDAWLNDDDVHQLFCLIAWRKKLTNVRIIEHCKTQLVMESEDRRHREVYRPIRALFRDNLPPLLFVPLYHSSHWSLLFYRTATRRWYHMDSLGAYHREYSEQVMRHLAELDLVDDADLTLHRFTGVERQPSGWQCGTCCLLFMLLVACARDDRDLQANIHKTGEVHRVELVRTLIDVLTNVY